MRILFSTALSPSQSPCLVKLRVLHPALAFIQSSFHIQRYTRSIVRSVSLREKETSRSIRDLVQKKCSKINRRRIYIIPGMYYMYSTAVVYVLAPFACIIYCATNSYQVYSICTTRASTPHARRQGDHTVRKKISLPF